MSDELSISLHKIAGTSEVSDFLDCPKQQIYALRKRPDFPQPVKVLAATPLWDLDEVATFKETWKRRPRKV
jgi:predicted DNA-binding transcriptional regulator AlpA